MGKLLNAVVRYPAGKTLTTQYGEKVNAVFDCDGQEIKIWADANSNKAEQLKGLVKGETVLILDDGGKYKLLDGSTGNTNGNGNVKGNSTPKTNQEYHPLPDDKKREIMAYIDEQAGLYSYCRETAIKTLASRFDEQELNPEDIRCMTATLYISVQKRFGI